MAPTIISVIVHVLCVAAGVGVGYALFGVRGVGHALAVHRCGPRERGGLVILPSDGERLRGRLDRATQARALDTFRACGIIAISKAINNVETDDFSFHTSRFIEPLLQSRERVRRAVRAGATWGTEELLNEPFLASGEAIRERQDGRLDLLLPHSMPFNSSGFVLNRFATGLIREIFDGSRFELKSAHAVVSLPGTEAQHWHRDDEPLFGDAYPTGVYGVNAFVALDDVPLESGPTEYILGSHLASHATVDQVLKAPHEATAFAWTKGSLVLMDYRTAHRGGANLAVPGSTRSLAMLVFGRPWWRDAVNYMGDNYGGADRASFSLDIVVADGGHADGPTRAVVARRLAQRQTSPADQGRDRAAMFHHCSALWQETWARGGGSTTAVATRSGTPEF